MTEDEVKALIGRAEAIVGHNPPTNRSLRAENGAKHHKDELAKAVAEKRATPAEVSPLLHALDDPAVREVLKRYNANNEQAKTAQAALHRKWGWLVWPLLLGFGITLVLALLPHGHMAAGLVELGFAPEQAARWAFLAPRALVVVSLVLVPFLALWLDLEGKDAEWRTSRGTAEALRRKFFEQLLAAPEPSQPGPIPTLLLKLEHFRRYQVEVQRAYHDITAADHARTASRARVARNICAFGLVLWSVLYLGLNVSGHGEQALAPVGEQLAGVSAAVMASLTAVEAAEIDYLILPASVLMGCAFAALLLKQSIRGSRRNAVRHSHARDNFTELAGRIGPAREAAARGTPDAADAVRRYMDTVHSVMSAELADWVRLAALDIGKPSAATTAPPTAAPAPVALPRAPRP